MVNMNEIRLLAEELSEGENRYTTCPSCGRAGKFSLGMVDGRVLYHCFRDSCELHAGGVVNTSGQRLVRTRPVRRKQKVTPYEGELMPLTDEWRKYLVQLLGFKDSHIDDIGRLMYAPAEHRIAYPIFSPMGRKRGWSLRSYTGAEPKALTRMDVEEPHMSWYMTKPDSPVAVVVEDQPSAIRAAPYLNSVALLGTGCGPDYAAELAAHVRNVVWALDADATQTALKWHRKYNLMFDSSRVLVLDKDLKDKKENEIESLLTGV